MLLLKEDTLLVQLVSPVWLSGCYYQCKGDQFISRYCKDLIKHITKWYLSLNRWLLVCRIVPPVKAIVMMGSLPVEGSQILPVVLIP